MSEPTDAEMRQMAVRQADEMGALIKKQVSEIKALGIAASVAWIVVRQNIQFVANAMEKIPKRHAERN